MTEPPKPTIWHTIPQAAEVMSVKERTIRKWIKDGHLPVKSHPLIPGVRYVDDADLLAASIKVGDRRGGSGRFKARDTDA